MKSVKPMIFELILALILLLIVVFSASKWAELKRPVKSAAQNWYYMNPPNETE